MSGAKWTGRGIGIALIAIAGFLLFTYEPAEPEAPPPVVRPAKTMVLDSPAEASRRRYTGRVQASRQVDLSFRVSGPLVELPVKAAQEVDEGEVLARIDPRDFQTRLDQISGNLSEAEAQLRAMKAGARPEDLRILENELSAAQARLTEAQRDLNREKRLFESGATTQANVDKAQAAFDVAREGVNVAQEALAKGKAGAREEDIEAQEARVRRLQASRREAENALADTAMRAPFAGKVARTYVENFQDVRAKQKILSVQDVSRVEIVADIPEGIVALFDKEDVEGFTAVFDFAPERTFEVEFSEAEVEADPRTQTYAATFTMAAPEDVRILPGMSATLQIRFKAAEAAVQRWLVPADAVIADAAGEPQVWRVDETSMTVAPVPVEVGDMRDDRIWILKGLSAGDRIVTAGVRLLTRGMKIRLMETQAK